MRHEIWMHSFELRADDPFELAETILARPARLVRTWIDKKGRKLRMYVPANDQRLMAIDEIITRQVDGSVAPGYVRRSTCC